MLPYSAGNVSKAFWLYQCTLQPYLFKTLAIAMALMSAAIVWSESTLRFDWVTLSPLAAVRYDSVTCAEVAQLTQQPNEEPSLLACRLYIETARVQLEFSCW